jgi:outer membrane immunogenic protein
MNKSSIAAIVAISVVAGAGSAMADDWSGLYGGLVIGGQAGTERKVQTVGTTAFRNLTPNIAPTQLKTKLEGISYGVVGGYNFHDGGALVWGVEGDLTGGGDSKPASFSGAPIAGLAPAGITTSARNEYGVRGSLRGRLGAAISDSVLVYGAGGLAVAKVETKASVVANGAPTVLWTGAKKDTLTGWTLGVGTEAKIGDSITLRAEYLYNDLGKVTVTAAGNSTVRGIAALNGIDYVARTEYKGGEVRLGVATRF